jgi:hypothetical protein
MKALKPYLGKTLTGDVLFAAAGSAQRIITEATVAVLMDSLSSISRHAFTEKDLSDVVLFLAANTDQLKRGVPATVALRSAWSGWTAAYVRSVSASTMKMSGQRELSRGWTLRVMIHTGPYAGMTLDKFVDLMSARAVASRCGFSSPYKSRPMRHPIELSGLYVAAYLVTDVNTERVAVRAINASPSMMSKNVSGVLKKRQRSVSKFSCPISLPVTTPCYSCSLGRDRCPVAVREKSLRKVSCHRCGQDCWQDQESDKHPQCASCAALPPLPVVEAVPCRPST